MVKLFPDRSLGNNVSFEDKTVGLSFDGLAKKRLMLKFTSEGVF